jgi:hypothetical protein
LERHEQIHSSFKQIFINNFFGGIAWALGATVGLTIIIALLGYILGKIDLVPFVGDFAVRVINFIISRNPSLLVK